MREGNIKNKNVKILKLFLKKPVCSLEYKNKEVFMIKYSNKNMDENLIVRYEWFPEWKTGLIQIVGQKARGNSFYQNSDIFYASNGIILRSVRFPERKIANLFYVRGSRKTQDDNIITIFDEDEFWKFLNAVEEYNNNHEVIKVNYLDLHHKLWTLLAETGSRDKLHYVEEVMKMFGLTKHPEGQCFLCEETRINAKSLTAECELCKGYWGPDTFGCLSDNSYYMMWKSESDLNLRKALARRIANNVINGIQMD